MVTETACGAEVLYYFRKTTPKNIKVHGNSTSLFRHSCVVDLCDIKADVGVKVSYIWLSYANTFKHNFINLSMKYTLLAIFVKLCRKTVSCKKRFVLFSG